MNSLVFKSGELKSVIVVNTVSGELFEYESEYVLNKLDDKTLKYEGI